MFAEFNCNIFYLSFFVCEETISDKVDTEWMTDAGDTPDGSKIQKIKETEKAEQKSIKESTISDLSGVSENSISWPELSEDTPRNQ